jgi:hypothetical protein
MPTGFEDIEIDRDILSIESFGYRCLRRFRLLHSPVVHLVSNEFFFSPAEVGENVEPGICALFHYGQHSYPYLGEKAKPEMIKLYNRLRPRFIYTVHNRGMMMENWVAEIVSSSLPYHVIRRVKGPHKTAYLFARADLADNPECWTGNLGHVVDGQPTTAWHCNTSAETDMNLNNKIDYRAPS